MPSRSGTYYTRWYSSEQEEERDSKPEKNKSVQNKANTRAADNVTVTRAIYASTETRSQCLDGWGIEIAEKTKIAAGSGNAVS